MNFENIVTILKKIIDICLVWVVFYYILKNVRKNVKFSLLFKGILAIVVIKLISDYFGLTTIGLLCYIMGTNSTYNYISTRD